MNKPLETLILTIRNQKVLVDADLASIYGVPTKRLNEAVKRNADRFPDDFLFRLTPAEKEEVVADCDHLTRLTFSPPLPHAFTEHGALMAANVLNSPEAVKMSVYVVRAFIKQRELLMAQADVLKKLARQKLTLRAGETNYAFTAIAEKRGFTAWLCESPDGGLPDHAARLKLDRKLSETSFEHLIVFVTGDRASQSWMWVRREQGKPLAARTHQYHRGQPGDLLLQKLQILYVSLEEEEAGLSTVAVAGRARAAFDIERVTKAFYRDFDTHRKDFLKFIDGISPSPPVGSTSSKRGTARNA